GPEEHEARRAELCDGDLDEEVGDPPDEGHRDEENPAASCHRSTLPGRGALGYCALYIRRGDELESVRIFLSRFCFCASRSCFSGSCECLAASGPPRVSRAILEISRLTRCRFSLSASSSPDGAGAAAGGGASDIFALGASGGGALAAGRGGDLRLVPLVFLIYRGFVPKRGYERPVPTCSSSRGGTGGPAP